MPEKAINEARYRALIYAAVCFGAICALGAASVPGLGIDARTHQALLALISVVCFVSPVFAARARAREDRAALQKIALVLVVLAGLALAEGVAWTFVSDLLATGQGAFRPHFAFLPLFYVASMVLIRGRAAMKVCWVFWGVVSSVTLAGLYYRFGFDIGFDGVLGLLIWMLVGNPLVLFLLSSLPYYTDELNRSAVELDQLEESGHRLDMVIESMQVAVWDLWLNPTPRRWAAPLFYKMIGYSPEDLEADEESVKALVHPEDRDRMWEEGARQLQQGDLLVVEFRLNTRHRGYRWFRAHGKAERDAGGHLTRLAGAVLDVHDRRSTEQALYMTQAELTRMAYRDTLTELHNRRYFDEHFKREWERARRGRQPITMMLVDLDHFKAYNDRYGHPAGDLCLVEVAHLLNRATSRATDVLARMGGEEFGIVLPETDAAGAEEVGARIQELLKGAAIPNEGSPDGFLTLSIGYAVLEDPDGPSANELYEQADRALYEVKRRGRNGILRFWSKAKLSVVKGEGE